MLAKTDTTNFPFGIWFANATTLYVADEGDGDTGADSGRPVVVTDSLDNIDPAVAARESFSPSARLVSEKSCGGFPSPPERTRVAGHGRWAYPRSVQF